MDTPSKFRKPKKPILKDTSLYTSSVEGNSTVERELQENKLDFFFENGKGPGKSKLIRDSRLEALQHSELASGFVFNQIYQKSANLGSDIIVSLPHVSPEDLAKTRSTASSKYKKDKKSKSQFAASSSVGNSSYLSQRNMNYKALKVRFNRSFEFVDELKPFEVENMLKMDEEFTRELEMAKRCKKDVGFSKAKFSEDDWMY